jgi:hypothetical protein
MPAATPDPSAALAADSDEIELSVVLPCLNEARTLQTCISKAQRSLAELGVQGEVVVADNGSTDGSRELAVRCGARLVDVPLRGYGAALRGGIEAARGRYVLMADADDSYALDDLGPFVDALRGGSQMVVGNRFAGGIEPGAMPALHRYVGNPVLSLLGRLFFRIPVRDFHCGIRAFDRDAARALDPRSTGMEFASELIVKSALAGHRITEVPTTLHKDGRDRPPHLRSWRDGWRHLRFLLLFSPRWLFLYPGLLLVLAGGGLSLRLSVGPFVVLGATLDVQSLLFATAAATVGAQAVLLAVLSRSYASVRGVLPPHRRLRHLHHRRALEIGVLAGLLLVVLGAAGLLLALGRWAAQDFGPLDLSDSLRLSLPSTACLAVGAQLLMASFFLGLITLDSDLAGGRVGPDPEGPR